MDRSYSPGSLIFAIVILLLICLLVLLLLRHYLPLRSTPAYLTIPVFLALALPCSIILLVPIDLASTTAEDDGPSRGVWLPEQVVLVTWRITYWLTFALTWAVLPILGEYVDSGHRDVKGRMLYSLRTNARYWIITIAAGAAGLVYFIWSSHGFHTETIKGLVMALAYAWGLILAIALMGHGLVALPRRVYRNAGVNGRLRRLQTQAPKTKEKLDDATDELAGLENIVAQLKQRKSGVSRDMQEWIDELSDATTIPDSRPAAAIPIRVQSAQVPAVVTERYLADIARKLRRATHKKARFVEEWNALVQRAQDTQTIVDAGSTKKLDFGRERNGPFGNLSLLTPSMRYQMHMNIIPALRIALSVVLAVASAMIVFSEIVRSFAPSASIIGLTVVHHLNSDGSKVGFAGQLIASAWLLYMIATALYAMSDVKVWGNRALVKRQTYAESASWYALQVAKLTVPLAYNFITTLPTKVYQQTQFYKFLGKLISLTPLGQGFSRFFPCLLLLPVLATLFNLYGRARSVIGDGMLEDESEENPSGFGTGGWREGRSLIERELQSHEGSRGASLDFERRTAPSAGTSTPTRGRPTPRDPLLPANVQEANRQYRQITNDQRPPADEDDSPRHFYQDFTERVKNTWDTAETPDWVRSIGSAFKAPKWMQDDSGEGGRRSSGAARWFGGRPDDGRVRL